MPLWDFSRRRAQTTPSHYHVLACRGSRPILPLRMCLPVRCVLHKRLPYFSCCAHWSFSRGARRFVAYSEMFIVFDVVFKRWRHMVLVRHRLSRCQMFHMVAGSRLAVVLWDLYLIIGQRHRLDPHLHAADLSNLQALENVLVPDESAFNRIVHETMPPATGRSMITPR